VTVGDVEVQSFEGAGLGKDDSKAKTDAFGTALKQALTAGGRPGRETPFASSEATVAQVMVMRR
jgi:hypothetical protein